MNITEFEKTWIPLIIGAVDVIAIVGLTVQWFLKRQRASSALMITP